MASVNTNIISLNAQRNLNSSQNTLSTSMQRLSSGLRVNSAKDDAAGLAIAERAARDGANVAIAAKSEVANPKLPGTIHSAARAVEAAGGRALALRCDIREEDQVRAAVAAFPAATHFYMLSGDCMPVKTAVYAHTFLDD